MQHERADGIAGPRRQDVVEEVADEERAQGVRDRGPPLGGEQEPPAHCAHEHRGGEDEERGDEPCVVALRQTVHEDAEVDVA